METDPSPAAWQWVNVQPLPTAFVERFDNLLFWDPQLPGFATGVGVSQIGNGEHRHLWSYTNGQWSLSTVPFELGFRSYTGWDYDRARRQLVLWGGNDADPDQPADALVWFMTKTSTNGPEAWRSALLDHPLPRFWPSVVYDSDRQVTLVFGGVRHIGDTRFVPPEIHQLIAQPSSPFVQAVIDLAAPRPKGIEVLHLRVRASGAGDADGIAAGTALAGGVTVKLWDHQLERWEDVATIPHELGAMTEIPIEIVASPERFVSADGTVPLTITSRYPATEALSARLDVDLIDGRLELRSGVVLP
jgi:hypothetical protein